MPGQEPAVTRVALLLVLIALVSGWAAAETAAAQQFDCVIYAATPAGIGAALTLSRMGQGRHRVAIVEPTGYVGGMASPGGIGLRDHQDTSMLNSTELEWALRNGRYYGVSYPVWQPDAHVGQATFLSMLSEAQGVTLFLNQTLVEGPAGVEKSGTAIRSITTENTNDSQQRQIFQAPYFIDASYEGDLAAAANASTTFGREPRSQYNESLGGISATSLSQFEVTVNALWPNGTLLPFLANSPDPRQHVGEGDLNVMAYSFRACLTSNKTNQAPFTPPPGYATEFFELSRRLIAGEVAAKKSIRLPWGNLAYSSYPPANKLDACCGSGPVGIDAVGLEMGYINGSRAERQAIYNYIRFYVQGLLYFWAADPQANVPAAQRAAYAALGLCKDEWPEHDHLPPQMYVREARRLVGDRVFTQNDRVPANTSQCMEDSIALGSWGIDIHDMQRLAVDVPGSPGQKMAYNEGLTAPNTAGTFAYEVPYWTLVPKRAEVTNLLAPNCPSISHVAFASLRVEPVLWRIGQAAGSAVLVALQQGSNVVLQDVNVTAVQDALYTQGVVYHYPFRQRCNSPVPPPPPPPSPPKCTHWQVKGAGTSEVNGNYTYKSMYENAPLFQHDGTSQVSLYRYGNDWHLAIMGESILYASNTGGNLPPSTGWQINNGTPPAPSFVGPDC